MVLDTSAIIATITNEQDSARFRAAMLGAESLLISSVAVLETRIVLFARLGGDAVVLFDELLENAGIVVVPEAASRTIFGQLEGSPYLKSCSKVRFYTEKGKNSGEKRLLRICLGS
jgi:hypothetical protein